MGKHGGGGGGGLGERLCEKGLDVCRRITINKYKNLLKRGEYGSRSQAYENGAQRRRFQSSVPINRKSIRGGFALSARPVLR